MTAQTSGSVSNVAAAIDGKGDAVVAWLQGGWRHRGRRPARASAAASRILSPRTRSTRSAPAQPSAAIDSGGNAIVAYQVTTSPTSIGANATRPAPARGRRAIRSRHRAATPSPTPTSPQIRPGKWSSRSRHARDGRRGRRARHRFRRLGGLPHRRHAVGLARISTDLLATISDAGNAVVGWSTSSTSSSPSSAPTGAFPAPAHRFSRSPTDTPDNFVLAGNGRGDAIAAMVRVRHEGQQTSCGPSSSRTRAHVRRPTDRLDPTVYSNTPVIGARRTRRCSRAVPARRHAERRRRGDLRRCAAQVRDGVKAGERAGREGRCVLRHGNGCVLGTSTLRWSFGDGSATAPAHRSPTSTPAAAASP